MKVIITLAAPDLINDTNWRLESKTKETYLTMELKIHLKMAGVVGFCFLIHFPHKYWTELLSIQSLIEYFQPNLEPCWNEEGGWPAPYPLQCWGYLQHNLEQGRFHVMPHQPHLHYVDLHHLNWSNRSKQPGAALSHQGLAQVPNPGLTHNLATAGPMSCFPHVHHTKPRRRSWWQLTPPVAICSHIQSCTTTLVRFYIPTMACRHW